MSDDDLRDELAAIASGVRRAIERERAAGGAELLAQSAAKARRGLSAGPVAASAAPTSAHAPVAMTTPAAAPKAAPAAAPAFAPASAPTLAPATAASALHAVAPVPTNLFGEPEPVATAIAEPEAFVLPPHHEPLHPVTLEARAVIERDSLPIMEQAAGEVRACTKCGLCETRTQAVPGVGSARSGIVFVGEAPGAEEDRRGEPFVGRAGELLTKIIKAMDDARLIPGVPLARETVYICNVLKCRPPENRNPLPHEIESCSPYLLRQLEALKPRIICCLGKFAAELLVGVKGTIAGMRGKTYRFHGAKLIVTYHPAACLRNPNYKRPVWEDMQRLALEYQTD